MNKKRFNRTQRYYYSEICAWRHNISKLISSIRQAVNDGDEEEIINFMRYHDLPYRIKKYRESQRNFYNSIKNK